MPRLVLSVSAAALALVIARAPARADSKECFVLDTEFTPAPDLQIVVWLEDKNGAFIDTAFITQLTGTYGIGNRPGLKDFNSAWHWPYGRREYVLPVWAHRHGKTFPKLVFRNNDDTNLSHPQEQSSLEDFFCRPLAPGEPNWDAQTCATSVRVHTDKGMLSPSEQSLYPPRVDVTPTDTVDDPAVATYKALNPFDAVSQATPLGRLDFDTSWQVPAEVPPGDYVVYVEVSKESDFNDTYNATTYPSPTKPDGSPLPWNEYGLPARGQPSVVYRIPITFTASGATAATSTFVGYGDPEGNDGVLHPPDATITTDTPGSGAARLQLTADDVGGTFRVRVNAKAILDSVPPDAPGDAQAVAVDQSSVTIDFIEPVDPLGHVTGYEVRYRAGTPMDETNFADSQPVGAAIEPQGPGTAQSVTVTGLLPQTDYYVGVRAYDECKNYGPLTVTEVKTSDRAGGYVDACFVATAAYGSLLANDVETLRRFRDRYLESNVLGELAVETYYSVGPAVAGVVDQSEMLRATARDVLSPVIEVVRPLVTSDR